MDSEQVLELAVTAGEIMLGSGGEVSRVEDTIARIVGAYGLKGESFVTPTGIFASAGSATLGSASLRLRRVRHRDLNLARVSAVNQFSRSLVANPAPLAEAHSQLATIAATPPQYTTLTQRVAGGLAGAVATFLLGGTPNDLIPGLAANLLVQVTLALAGALGLPGLLANFGGAALSSATAFAFYAAGWPLHIDLVIAGGLIALAPGLAFTGAIRDGISGDLLSAAARGLDALLSATALAGGVGTALYIYLTLGGHM